MKNLISPPSQNIKTILDFLYYKRFSHCIGEVNLWLYTPTQWTIDRPDWLDDPNGSPPLNNGSMPLDVDRVGAIDAEEKEVMWSKSSILPALSKFMRPIILEWFCGCCCCCCCCRCAAVGLSRGFESWLRFCGCVFDQPLLPRKSSIAFGLEFCLEKDGN